METLYLCVVIFLLCLAVFDLFVGVSNDAVNFLQSAVGARVATFRTVLIIASVAVVLGAVLSSGMMDIARQKVKDLGLAGTVKFRKEDCMALSFADNTFDAVTAAFGIRNFQNLDRGLAEMCRVLKKGGHLSIAELTTPVAFPMRQLFSVYSHTFLPAYGKFISKDRSAYDYLTATIEAFPQGERMMDILKGAGFSKVAFRRLTFGICTIYFAEK